MSVELGLMLVEGILVKVGSREGCGMMGNELN